MDFSIRITDPLTAKTACLVVAVDKSLSGSTAKALDNATKGMLSALKESGDLPEDNGDCLMLPIIADLPAQRLLLVGTGDKTMNDQGFIKFANAIATTLSKSKSKDAILCIEDVAVTERDQCWKTTQTARLIGEAAYQFSQFKSKKPTKQSLQKITIQLTTRKGSDAIKNALLKGAAIATGVNQARELGDLPSNICNPTYLANKANLGVYFSATKGMSDVTDAQNVINIFGDQATSNTAAAKASVDGHYTDATAAGGGDSLFELVGIVADPFAGFIG
jgi:leucyl aminopeptidase